MAANGSAGAPPHHHDDDNDEEARTAAPSTAQAAEPIEPTEDVSETTPLLPPTTSSTNRPTDQSQPYRERSAEALLRTLTGGKGSGRRWPSLIALLVLCIVVLCIIVFVFVAPSVVEQYAMAAVVFEPTSLSIAAFTASGVRARIEGDFTLDAQRVRRKPVRDLGRFGTWIAREVESGPSEVRVSLPEYGNVVLGIAHVPGIKVNVRDGHRTHVDFLTDMEPGNKEGIRRLAKDWVDGRLGQLRVVGTAKVPLKSGIFSLGKQTIKHEMLFANDDMPEIPGYDIEKLLFKEKVVDGNSLMEADVSILVENDYPFDFTVPALGFQILVDNCAQSDPYINVARAMTHRTHVLPKKDMELNVTGLVQELPDRLIQSCPGSKKSPLDIFVGRYMNGEENTIYVRGAQAPSKDTPAWIGDLISDITVPLSLPGKSFGHLIKNFTLEDTHFSLPEPWAQPGSPESHPQISANVKALIALPEEMNFNIGANRVRARADVFYKGSKLGNLDLSKWQPANSTRIEDEDDGKAALLVSSHVEKAPLIITNEDLFTDVVQDLLFGRKSVLMKIKADVDVEIETALGAFKVRDIPAEGEVPVKPLSPHPPGKGDGNNTPLTKGLNISLSDLRIANTTPTALTLSALLNFTNPTHYAATIPYIDIHLLHNGTLIGHAYTQNVTINPNKNNTLNKDNNNDTTSGRSSVLVTAVYGPKDMYPTNHTRAEAARLLGREMLSEYISGWNISLGVRLHEGSLPSNPLLGRALGKFEIAVPAPSLHAPDPETPGPPGDGDGNGDGGDDDDDDGKKKGKGRFIRDGTFHLWSSTATFKLFSPLKHSTLVIEKINATAFLPKEKKDDSTMMMTEPTTESERLTDLLDSHDTRADDLNSNTDDYDDNDDDDDDDNASITGGDDPNQDEEAVGRILYEYPFAVPPVGSDGEGTLTPRLPVDWSLGGVGYGNVRKALGGRLNLRAFAWVGLRLGEFREEIWYQGKKIGAKVRL